MAYVRKMIRKVTPLERPSYQGCVKEVTEITVTLDDKSCGTTLSITCNYCDLYDNGNPTRKRCDWDGGADHEHIKRVAPELASLCDWHLNDLHAECVHQKDAGIKYHHVDDRSHPYSECSKNRPCKVCNLGAVCGVCGWRLGYGWAFHPLPEHIIQLVQSLGGDK